MTVILAKRIRLPRRTIPKTQRKRQRLPSSRRKGLYKRRSRPRPRTRI